MEKKKQETLAELLYFWIQTFTAGLIAFVLIFIFLGRLVLVDGHSMDPTLADGELVLVRRIGYTPRQGDVVVLYKPFENVTGAIVKRVIATEGQSVEIDYAAGTVAVDGAPLEEDYILEPMVQRWWQTTVSTTVPEGCVFVMGDNRNVSNDSRNPNLDAVDQRCILGQALAVVFPLQNLGGIA